MRQFSEDGAESLIVILGIVWLSSTIIGAHIGEIKDVAGSVLNQYPALFVSCLLRHQCLAV